MSFSDKADGGEALVETFAIANLEHVNNSEADTLDEFTQEMVLESEDMDTNENELIVETQEHIEHEEEVVQTEIEPQEIEIETEEQADITHSPEEILPDVKVRPSVVPPLRPLTIAPKPKQIPIAVKPVAGQQLLLVQGGNPSQAIKLVSPQGQEINLANYTLTRPVTIKPVVKTITTQGGNISIVQQKPVIMKKIVTTTQKTMTKPITFAKPGQQFMVIQKPDQQQQVKLVQTASGNAIAMTSPTKTITLQQAQEMGLLANAKFVSQSQPGKQTVVINRSPQKTIKLVPQGSTAQILTNPGSAKAVAINQIKSPTKILPATTITGGKTAQRIIFKSATTGAQTILPPGQLIQVAGTPQTLSAGQIHQINIPGKGMQYIKFVTTASTASSSAPVNVVSTIRTTTTIPAGTLTEIKPTIVTSSKIAPKPITVKSTLNTNKIAPPVVVLPNYSIAASQPHVISKVAIPQIRHSNSPMKRSSATPSPKPANTSNTSSSEGAVSPVMPSPANSLINNLDRNGIRARKACNCTKSQCLKLYCDCFANGEFCFMCNCSNCYNNLENEDSRNRAIKACLERNPHAFRPKIGKAKDTTGDVSRKHTKGCNCKRSGCLKNYCECYEAKIACSSNCRCIGCRNIEDALDKKNVRLNSSMDKSDNGYMPERCYRKILPYSEDSPSRIRRPSNMRKQTLNFITDDVIEATCQCLLTISDNADSNMQDDEITKRQIIEEFGRCMTEIINCSTNRSVS